MISPLVYKRSSLTALPEVGGGACVELLGELLGDGGGAAGGLVAHHDGLDGGAAECAEVDAAVVVEADVLGGDEGVDDGL